MKQVLIETRPFQVNPIKLTENRNPNNGNPLVEGILATPEVKNGNGRYYSKDLWQREINKYLTVVKENRATGELDHPESSIINLKNVCHIIATLGLMTAALTGVAVMVAGIMAVMTVSGGLGALLVAGGEAAMMGLVSVIS